MVCTLILTVKMGAWGKDHIAVPAGSCATALCYGAYIMPCRCRCQAKRKVSALELENSQLRTERDEIVSKYEQKSK